MYAQVFAEVSLIDGSGTVTSRLDFMWDSSELIDALAAF